jgi:hypothetical protein
MPRTAWLVATSLALLACAEESTTEPPPPPDEIPPLVEVVFPTEDAWDADGDQLLDVELAWRDASGIDLGGVRMTSSRGAEGGVGFDTDLLDVWPVERRDVEGLVVHEGIQNLLLSRSNTLTITVPDTAGNVTTVRVHVSLPAGEVIRTIRLGEPGLVRDIALCPDEPVALAAIGFSLATIDLESFETTAVSPAVPSSSDVMRVLCLPDGRTAWVTTGEGVWSFDRTSRSWRARAAGSVAAVGITRSRADPDLLYVGETYTGDVGVIDMARGERTGSLGLPPSASPLEIVGDLVALPGDETLYVPRQEEGGILTVEPGTGAVRGRIDYLPFPGTHSRVHRIALDDGGTRLYAAVESRLWEIDTATDSVTRTADISGSVPDALALDPVGDGLFLTRQNPPSQPDFPSTNLLMNVSTWSVLDEFLRSRPEGQWRYDLAAVFHPNGVYLLAGHDGDIDVYLTRE